MRALMLAVAGTIALPGLGRKPPVKEIAKNVIACSNPHYSIAVQTSEQETPAGAAGDTGAGEAQTQVEDAVRSVNAPGGAVLAKALGAIVVAKADELPGAAAPSLMKLSGFNDDKIPEFVLKWMGKPGPATDSAEAISSPPFWNLFLLSWDGTKWLVSSIHTGFEPFSLEELPPLVSGTREIALVVYAGDAAIPYPSVFELKNHAATLLWDGRSDESRYEGYAFGQIEFRKIKKDGFPELVSTGRADPGIIVFPRDGRRGFDARTIYVWQDGAYIPVKTEYSANEDYTLYRFISALHLHDFSTAYGLIDPGKFLKTDKPGLKEFRRQVEDSWSEFLDDKIFEALEPKSGSADSYQFELESQEKTFVYTPTFSLDSKHALTSLSRREETREAQ